VSAAAGAAALGGSTYRRRYFIMMWREPVAVFELNRVAGSHSARTCPSPVERRGEHAARARGHVDSRRAGCVLNEPGTAVEAATVHEGRLIAG